MTSRALSAAAARATTLVLVLATGGLAGCQALGGSSGVMPDTSVGLPPSMRDALPGREARNAGVDDDGRPLQTAPTRQLALPKNAGAGNRTAAASERRISRDELEGSSESRSASGSMAPGITSNGGVGLGGKF